MRNIDRLVEQHIRESDLRLQHIDELMARAVRPPTLACETPEVKALLGATRTRGNRLSHELDELRGGMTNGGDQGMVRHGATLKSKLQMLGDQFERTLAAVFDTRGV